MVDKEAIVERIKALQKYRSLLEDYVGETFAEFTEDYEHYAAALHSLQVCIQACLDVAQHLVAAESFEKTEEIKQIFLILAKMKIVRQELAEKLVQAGSVRNILVHNYLEVDLQKIHKHLQEDLPDFDEFATAISQYLQNIKEAPRKS